jgi:hypothetical protein
MDSQPRVVNTAAYQADEHEGRKPELSFASICEHLEEGRPSNRKSRIRATAIVTIFVVTLGGLIFTVWSSRPNSGYSAHATLLGFGVEIIGLVCLMVICRAYRAFGRGSSARDDMADYDAQHAVCSGTIEWLGQFDVSKIAGMRSMLEEQRRAQDTASRWMFGSAEKLGVLPALAAILVQGLSIARPTGLAASAVSGLAVGATFAFCAITFVLTRDRVRDQRLAWLLESAENMLSDADSSQLSSHTDIVPQ